MSRDQEEKEKPKRDNTRNLKALLGASLVVNVVLIISVSTDTMSIGTVATRSFIKTGSDSCGPSSKLLGGEAEAVVDSVTVEGHKSVPIKDPHLQAVLRGCGEVCRYDTPRQPSKASHKRNAEVALRWERRERDLACVGFGIYLWMSCMPPAVLRLHRGQASQLPRADVK